MSGPGPDPGAEIDPMTLRVLGGAFGSIAKEMAQVRGQRVATKSGIMLGLGETEQEILKSMDDLRDHHVTVLTMGQYLRPTPKHAPVREYVAPERFAELRQLGEELGFQYVASGPLVRSSYKAAEFYAERLVRARRAATERADDSEHSPDRVAVEVGEMRAGRFVVPPCQGRRPV